MKTRLLLLSLMLCLCGCATTSETADSSEAARKPKEVRYPGADHPPTPPAEATHNVRR